MPSFSSAIVDGGEPLERSHYLNIDGGSTTSGSDKEPRGLVQDIRAVKCTNATAGRFTDGVVSEEPYGGVRCLGGREEREAGKAE